MILLCVVFHFLLTYRAKFSVISDSETLLALLAASVYTNTQLKALHFTKKKKKPKHSWHYWQQIILSVPAPSISPKLTVASVIPHVSGAHHPFFFVCSCASCMSALVMLWVSLLPLKSGNANLDTMWIRLKKEMRQLCCEKQCSFRLCVVIPMRGLWLHCNLLPQIQALNWGEGNGFALFVLPAEEHLSSYLTVTFPSAVVSL